MLNVVDHSIWRERLDFIPETSILYGSYARGDFNDDSDIDLLLVHPSYKESFHVEKFAISVYSKAKLMELSRSGSIFILHLIKEARHLKGIDILPDLRASFKQPDTKDLLYQISEACKLLHMDIEFYQTRQLQANHIQKFIIRSLVYLKSIESGFEEFNIKKALNQLDMLYLSYLFDRQFLATMTYKDFIQTNKIIESLTGIDIYNEYNTIEALLLNNAPKKNLLHTLGMSILKNGSPGVDYPNIAMNG